MTYAAAVKTPPATRSDFSTIFGVPADVGAVVRDFRSCELSTFARDGTPVTWPTMPYFEPDRRRFLITSSISHPRSDSPKRRSTYDATLMSRCSSPPRLGAV